MKYTIENIQKTETPVKFLFFWGHQPNKDNVITKSCFSQWWESSFKIDDITYWTAEHYMMAEKARLFNNEEIRRKIITSKSPGEAKKLGREVTNFNQEIWQNNCFEIVKKGNYEKFNQNKNLKDFIIKTQNRILVEASPVDAIWGIGMAENHRDIMNPNKWRGENLLGFALMEVRDELL